MAAWQAVNIMKQEHLSSPLSVTGAVVEEANKHQQMDRILARKRVCIVIPSSFPGIFINDKNNKVLLKQRKPVIPLT